MRSHRAWRIILLSLLAPLALYAQDAARKTGPETNLPIPRFISLKTDKANMRNGPSFDYPIAWVYTRRGLPVKVIGESGHWRKVEAADGTKGWFLRSLLSGRRTAIVQGERVALGETPGHNATPLAWIEPGVIVELRSCEKLWCLAEIDRYRGWLPKDALWGVEADEVFE